MTLPPPVFDGNSCDVLYPPLEIVYKEEDDDYFLSNSAAYFSINYCVDKCGMAVSSVWEEEEDTAPPPGDTG